MTHEDLTESVGLKDQLENTTTRTDTDLEKPLDPIIRIPLLTKILSISRTSIYRMVARGEFPPPIRLTSRSIGWRKSVVKTWVNLRESLTQINNKMEIQASESIRLTYQRDTND
jgi:prophage regulatory protein